MQRILKYDLLIGRGVVVQRFVGLERFKIQKVQWIRQPFQKLRDLLPVDDRWQVMQLMRHLHQPIGVYGLFRRLYFRERDDPLVVIRQFCAQLDAAHVEYVRRRQCPTTVLEEATGIGREALAADAHLRLIGLLHVFAEVSDALLHTRLHAKDRLSQILDGEKRL